MVASGSFKSTELRTIVHACIRVRPIPFVKRSRMRRFHILARLLLAAATLAALMRSPALADAEADKAAIAARLQAWSEAFNARDATKVCDIFAPDLVATFRGARERGREDICANLVAVIKDRTRTVRYAPEIKEILIEGDLAVVRLDWDVTVQRGPKPAQQQEPGMDIFRRGPDGRWSIVRFLAYSNAPD